MLAGCGGDDVDFSKPTIKPGGGSAAKPPAPKPDSQPAAQPEKSEPASASAAAKPAGSEESATVAAGDGDAGVKQPAEPARSGNSSPKQEAAAAVAEKIDFDPAWLPNRDQVTSFSDDGSLVAVGSADGRLRMFDVGAGAVRDVFRTQRESITQVIVSPDNTVLAAVTADGHLRLHSSGGPQGFDQYSQSRLATGIQQRGIGVHAAPVTAGAWQPQGRLLATAAADSSLHLWGMPLRDAVELTAAGDEVVAVTVNAENDVVASVTSGGQVRLIDFADQSVLTEFTVKDAGTITRIALVSSSDTVLLGTQDGAILAYSSLRGEEITRLTAHQGEVTCLAVAADGRAFLSGDSVGQLRLWRLPLSGASQLARFDAEVDELKVTSDRRYAASLVRGRGLSLVRLAVPPVIRPVSGRSDDLTAVCFVRSGSVLAGATRGGAVRFWSVPNGDLIAETAAHDGPIRGISPHPRDLSVATAGEDGRIRLLEVPTRLPQIRNAGSELASLSSSDDGLLLTANSGNGQIRLWQTVNGSQVGQLDGQNGRATAHSSGRSWIAVGDESGAIRFLKSDSVQPAGDVQTGNSAVTHLAIDDRSGTAFSVDADGVVRELTAPPNVPRSLKLPVAGVSAVASFEDGRQAIIATRDRKLLQIDTAGEKPASRTLGQLQSDARAAAVLQDGSIAITGHADGGVELHGEGRSALRFDFGDSASVRSVVVESAGRRALTVHDDGAVREWNLNGVAIETSVEVPAATLAAINASGSLAALATEKKTVAVVQIADGTVLREIGPLENPITALGWEADGVHLLTGEQDGQVRRLNASTGEERIAWRATAAVTAIVALPESSGFLIGLESGAVQKWSSKEGMTAELRPAGNAPIRQLAAGADGALLILAGQQAEQWSLKTGAKTGDVDGGPVSSLAFAADGKTPLLGKSADGEQTLLTGVWGRNGAFRVGASGVVTFRGADNSTMQWKIGRRVRSVTAGGGNFVVITEDGRNQIVTVPLRRTLKVPRGVPLAVGREPGEDAVLAVTSDSQLVRWAAASDGAEVVRTLNAGTTLEHAALDESGSMAAAISGTSAFVWSLEAGSGNEEATARPIVLPSKGSWLKLNRSGNRLLTGLANGDVLVIDTAQRTVLEQVSVPQGNEAVVEFSGGSDSILIGSSAAELKVLQPTVRRILATDAKSVGDVGIAKGQFRIVSNDGATRCWDAAAEPVINRAAADGEAARLTRISGNGEWVVQVFGDSSVGTRRLRDGLEPTLFTVDSPVSSLAVSHDGQLVAIALQSGVRVVDRAGNLVQSIEREKEVEQLTFVGRQSTLALSSSDGSIDFSAFSQTEQELKVDGPVTGVAWNAAATQLVSWDDRRVRLWNLETADEQLQFDDSSTPILQAGFADGDQLLAGIAQDGRIYVWSLADRKLRNQFAGPTDPHQAVISSNGLAIAVVRQSGRLETYSLSNGQLLEVCNPDGADVQSLDLRADDLAVFAGGRNGHITERSLSATVSIAAHGSQRITDATFSARNGFLLSCGEDGVAALHQSEGRLIRKFEGATGTPVGVAESPDSSLVFVISATADAGALTKWKLADATLQQQQPLPVKPGFCRTASLQGLLAAVDRSGRIQLIDTANGSPNESIVTTGDVTDAVIAGIAETVVAVGRNGGLTAYPFQLAVSLDSPGVATSIDWSGDGRYLVAGTTGLVSIWDIETSSLVTGIPVGELPPYDGREGDEASKDPRDKAKRLASRNRAPERNEVRRNVRPARSNPVASEPEGVPPATEPPGTLTTQVLITPMGELCASFIDGSVRVWDLKQATRPGEPPVPHTIFRHPSPVRAVAVDPLGKRVACGCEDSNIWLWDVATGQELARFSGHKGAITSLAFEESGRRLFSTGSDRAAKVWPLNTPNTGSKADMEIAIASSSEELRKSLQTQLQAAERAEDRTRLRRVIRTLDDSDRLKAEGSEAEPEDGEISNLRATLRDASVEGRSTARRDLLFALRKKEIESEIINTEALTERQRLRRELDQLRAQGNRAGGQKIRELVDADRQLAKLQNSDPQKSVLKERMQDLLRENPIWPRTPRDTWSRDDSHLIASLQTDFNFDTNLRPVELALTEDGLTLAAARESAELESPSRSRPRTRGEARQADTPTRESRRALGVVRVWDVLTGTELRAWNDVENSSVDSVAFSGSGDTVFTTPDLFVFRLSTGESLELASGVSLSLSPDRLSAVAGLPGRPLEMSDALRLIDIEAMQFLPRHVDAYEALVPAVAISNDGRTLAAAIRERARHRLVEYDASSLSERTVVEEFSHRKPWYEDGELGIMHLAYSPNDRYLVAYGTYGDKDYRLTVIHRASGESSTIKDNNPIARRDSIVPLRFAGSSDLLVIDARTGLHVVNMEDGRTLDRVDYSTLTGGDRLVRVSGDGSVAAFGSADGVVTLRKLGQSQGRVHFQAHAGPVVGIAFSDGDRMLVTAGEENQIRVWSLAGFLNSRQPADPIEMKTRTGERRGRP